MIILLESVRILGLGAGLFAIIVILLIGFIASIIAWTFNKGLPVLVGFMAVALVLILVFILSPKSNDSPTTTNNEEEYDNTIVIRGAVGAVLGLGVIVSLLSLLISHGLSPIYASNPHNE